MIVSEFKHGGAKMGTDECKKILDEMGVQEIGEIERLSEFRDKVIQDTKAQIKEHMNKVL